MAFGLLGTGMLQGSERTANELAGLWYAERTLGPQLRGVLDVYRYDGGWQGEMASRHTQSRDLGSDIQLVFDGDHGEFRGQWISDENVIVGHWIQPPNAANGVRFASPLKLVPVSPNRWRGDVVPLDDRMTFYLSLGERTDGSLGGFLRNPEANFGRFFTIENVVIEEHTVRITEPGRTQSRLHGPYYADHDMFSLFIPDAGGTFDFNRVHDAQQSTFRPRSGPATTYRYRVPLARADGWPAAHLDDVGMAVEPVEELVRYIIDAPMDSIDAPYIHAVLIARHGKLVVEEYFHGYTADQPHETRSASKTVSTTLAGLAIQGGEPVDLSSPVYDVMYGGAVPEGVDPRKSRIRLEHLLTMTPGLACDDTDAESPGGEDRMQAQAEQPNWWQYTLDLPSLHEPGEVVTYCSASPNLVLGGLQNSTGTWIPRLFQTYFADPLQLGIYHMNLMPSGDPYGGGGLYIRGRDFLKLAQLYLDGGIWNDRRLLGENWVRDAVTPNKRMFDQGYGYGWWIMEFPYGDGTVEAFYAGGNGGQYSMGIPELDLAIVIFGGNYNQATTHLVKKDHIPNYILRSVLEGAER
jgi:CubicO group peptidase (beta-lactamase class C family)